MIKLVSLLSILALSMPVFAEDIEEVEDEFEEISAGVAFDMIDINEDGVIDEEEATADETLAQDFPRIAKNGKLDARGFYEWKSMKAKNTAS